MKDNQQEQFPIVDEEGTVIGKATRGECHNGSRLLHPVVHLHVFRSGDLYLQKRPEWKDIQPGKWDTAVGGHIDYGEEIENALHREVREELGITDFTPTFIGKYVFEGLRERELVYVYRTTYDGPIQPSKDELDGGRFWTMQEIREAIGQRVLTPNFESEFQRFFSRLLMTQVDRIKTMEHHLDRASRAVTQLSTALDDYAEAQEDLRELKDYYGSDEWKQDFADDEAGLLPKDLKRGVLSEDGIWNVLEDSRNLDTRIVQHKRYALFFDIDGTLVSFKTHEIPPSTILALTQAKANGSRVYIATGRPPIIITNLGAIEHLIDGYITTNGALCFVGEELVCCQPIDKENVMTCVEDSKAKGYSLIVVGRKDVAVLDPSGDVDRIFRQMLAVKNLDKASPLDVVLQQDILQLTPFFPADYEPELMARMPKCVSGRWHPEFTDITANGADKGKGILAMARHEGFDPSRTIAFGDGGNDTSMILQAGIGIAMGNAIDELKQQADYVTTSVDDDGILHALRHFEVI